MKLNHISALLLFLFVYAFAGYSQVEDEEVQMFSFSGTRGIGETASLNFGTVKNDAKIMSFFVPNNGKTELRIDKISIPEGVGVVVKNEVIKPGTKGEIIVIVDPKYIKQGSFIRDLTITTTAIDKKGTSTSQTGTIKLKGQVL
jgi:hypothetical protein